ncbi:MAG: membrane protein insertase YidC [Sphingomonadales bacterium]
MGEQKNLILAVVLTFVILIGFQYLAPAPTPPPVQTQQNAGQIEPATVSAGQDIEGLTPQLPAGADAAVPSLAPAQPDVTRTRQEALAASGRIEIVSPRLRGSIPITGRRIDDILLSDYTETQDADSTNIVLLSPAGARNAYYAEFGWASVPGANVATPSPDTVWTADRAKLGIGQPVTLTWDSDQGLRFTRTYAIDDNYMFTITQRVVNTTSSPVTLAPFGLISRTGTPDTSGFVILHEGALGAFENALLEVDYEEMREAQRIEKTSVGGWIGITDKYWLTALIPDQNSHVTGHFNHRLSGGQDKYQVDFLLEAQSIPAGGSIETASRLFAGAKEVRLIDGYEKSLGIARFDRAIDWGWLFWLTKPIFMLLGWINDLIGNFGLAILVLTVVIKALFFPLANKSYVQMGKMKKLQPKMTAIRETFADDKVRQQQEMMALYKKEQVNPMGGCLPMLVQIPVFFALYKVLFVTIEMRHAPFFGWVQDLSAPDELLWLNLFGLIPWDPPGLLAIGVWPVLMGVSMFLQQKLNPQPADPMQAKVFMIMPVMFTFLLATFPVGLVIYWTWNNMLTMAQQWVIMKRTEAES